MAVTKSFRLKRRKSRHGLVRHGLVRQGLALLGKAWRSWAGLGMVWRGKEI